jgi:hypothetical protein
MTPSDHDRLRHVPRVHAALIAPGDHRTHAAAPMAEQEALCGVAGSVVRHLLEDVSRAETCPACQAKSDAIRAADLLGAVAGAAGRGQLELAPEILEAALVIERALCATYPDDPSRPNFDVRYQELL